MTIPTITPPSVSRATGCSPTVSCGQGRCGSPAEAPSPPSTSPISIATAAPSLKLGRLRRDKVVNRTPARPLSFGCIRCRDPTVVAILWQPPCLHYFRCLKLRPNPPHDGMAVRLLFRRRRRPFAARCPCRERLLFSSLPGIGAWAVRVPPNRTAPGRGGPVWRSLPCRHRFLPLLSLACKRPFSPSCYRGCCRTVGCPSGASSVRIVRKMPSRI